MSRNACVIHMSAVTLAQITRNAPIVVRKIYRPMDPIRLTRPRSRQNPRCAGPLPPDGVPMVNRSPFYPLFDRATKWLGQGKAFEYAQQNVNPAPVARRPQNPPRETPNVAPGGAAGGALQARASRVISGVPLRVFSALPG